jgi:membrane-bound ClpP family serine protease
MTALVPGNANEFIEQQLDERIRGIEDYFKSDALSLAGPIVDGVDNLLRIAVEHMRTESRRRRLTVVLTTKGGYIEVVRRIVDMMRTHYRVVDFVIPDYAYSAGTVLALSGDNIYMDYYSRLGPIDPQVETPSGKKLVPALGYLEQYNRLIKKAKDGTISVAEVRLLMTRRSCMNTSKHESCP